MPYSVKIAEGKPKPRKIHSGSKGKVNYEMKGKSAKEVAATGSHLLRKLFCFLSRIASNVFFFLFFLFPHLFFYIWEFTPSPSLSPNEMNEWETYKTKNLFWFEGDGSTTWQRQLLPLSPPSQIFLLVPF